MLAASTFPFSQHVAMDIGDNGVGVRNIVVKLGNDDMSV